jgi:indole-3-glycerol phosphate synthase
MTQQTETILDSIVSHKRQELEASKRATAPEAMRRLAEVAPAARDFAEALAGPGIGLIAEVKKASPSRGVLRADFDAVDLARRYAEAGAAAISVLTDVKHFQGTLDDLESVRSALPQGPPLLRKDFVFDPYQVYEARARGADAVLLIAAILEQPLLADLSRLVESLGMTPLVEVHDEAEMERAVAISSRVVGINNRDLRTFEVDLGTSERLRSLAPPDTIVVAESGIFSRDDMRRLEACGVQAVLIGEALITAPDPGARIRELLG